MSGSNDDGTFIGINNQTSKVISWRGIPYADPPVGHLRWRAAVSPPTKHLGKVNATNWGDACIITTATRVVSGQSENCLFANIHQQSLVWFHGGGYQGGNTREAIPDITLQTSLDAGRPFVFVSFAYRLGQFGFLGFSFGIYVTAGSPLQRDGQLNIGLQDQREALRWVQRYISVFGGDPNRVTVWGQSAGAGSTLLHLIANGGNNENLFIGAIGDSPAFNAMPAYNDPYLEDVFEQFASLAGCDPKAQDKVMSCLRGLEAGTIASAGSRLIGSRNSTLYVFAPYLDGEFITERPNQAYGVSKKFARVPVLFGSNTNEGATWSARLRNPDANTSMPHATQDTVYNFLHGQYPYLTKESFDKAVKLYPIADYNGNFSLQGQQMYGEMRFICAAELITSSYAGEGLEAYRYRYNNPHLGSNHHDELQAFFVPSKLANPADLELFKEMRESWSSFVTNDTTLTSAWQPVSASSLKRRLLLDPNGIAMEDVPGSQSERCAFWSSVSGELRT
ncbi:vacuolar triacylglycerol lipase [Moniliophthora roreri]|nr:vacuolar triacylglycerol lipase [Moniliophthora roreri]